MSFCTVLLFGVHDHERNLSHCRLLIPSWCLSSLPACSGWVLCLTPAWRPHKRTTDGAQLMKTGRPRQQEMVEAALPSLTLTVVLKQDSTVESRSAPRTAAAEPAFPGAGSWRVKEGGCPDTGRGVCGPPRGGARTVQEGGKLNNAGHEEQTDHIVLPSEGNSLDFLLVPWIRIRLPVRGTWARSLAPGEILPAPGEILPAPEQIKPVRHNY